MSARIRYHFKRVSKYEADEFHNNFENDFKRVNSNILTYKVIEETSEETFNDKKQTYYITIEYTNTNEIEIVEKKIDKDSYMEEAFNKKEKIK